MGVIFIVKHFKQIALRVKPQADIMQSLAHELPTQNLEKKELQITQISGRVFYVWRGLTGIIRVTVDGK
jgi:hypothetical protein